MGPSTFSSSLAHIQVASFIWSRRVGGSTSLTKHSIRTSESCNCLAPHPTNHYFLSCRDAILVSGLKSIFSSLCCLSPFGGFHVVSQHQAYVAAYFRNTFVRWLFKAFIVESHSLKIKTESWIIFAPVHTKHSIIIIISHLIILALYIHEVIL